MSFTKDPAADLDYEWDWTAWLATGETITAATVSSVPTGLTVGAVTNTATTATVWLSGGASDTTYTVSCQVTTSAGRVDVRSIGITVQPR